jgi:hypothetical protein
MNAVVPLKTLVEQSFTDQIAVIVEHCKALAQVDCPVTHRFAPGVYLREIFMPADTVVIGKVHKTEHFNILLKGACLIVHADGTREELRAPATFVSKPNVQKVLYITEDMIWQTVHVTDEIELPKLEAILISKEHPELSDEARHECARIAEERRFIASSEKVG